MRDQISYSYKTTEKNIVLYVLISVKVGDGKAKILNQMGASVPQI
jgi:hypothetical protein